MTATAQATARIATARTATAQNATAQATVPQAAVECPECYADLPFAQAPLLHEILPCSDCGVELEVISLAPLEVDLAPEVEEDWGE